MQQDERHVATWRTPAGLRVCVQVAEQDHDVWRRVLAEHFPDLHYLSWEAALQAGSIDVAIVWDAKPFDLASLRGLRHVVVRGAGVDHLLSGDAPLPSNVKIHRIIDRSVEVRMKEYVTLAVLFHFRRWERFTLHRSGQCWLNEEPSPSAAHYTVGVLGFGALGRAICEALLPFGFKLRAWSNSKKEMAGIGLFHGKQELPSFASGLDALVCALPITGETRRIIDRDLLAQLNDHAHLINVGRGEHVDEDDLIAALAAGKIGLATLDVFRQEPLPNDHPFWGNSKIILTNHTAAVPPPEEMAEAAARVLSEALSEGCKYEVNIARGY